MNKLLTFLGFTLFVVMVYWFDLLFGSLGFMVLVAFGVSVDWKREQVRTLKEYGGRFENIYVVSNHPVTDEKIDLPKYQNLIVCAEYTDVLKRCEKERDFLKLSENQFFETGNEAQQLKVIPIIFQDAKFINEDWDEFTDRVRIEIATDRAKKHKALEKGDPRWYAIHGNNQKNVFEWVKK